MDEASDAAAENLSEDAETEQSAEGNDGDEDHEYADGASALQVLGNQKSHSRDAHDGVESLLQADQAADGPFVAPERGREFLEEGLVENQNCWIKPTRSKDVTMTDLRNMDWECNQDMICARKDWLNSRGTSDLGCRRKHCCTKPPPQAPPLVVSGPFGGSCSNCFWKGPLLICTCKTGGIIYPPPHYTRQDETVTS